MRPAYLLVLGDEEESNRTISYLGPDREKVNGVEIESFVESLREEISQRK